MERYKVVLSNSRLYREIELEPDAKYVRFGTGKDCMVRFDIDMFFDGFDFTMENHGESWTLVCGGSNYVSSDGILKLSTKELTHGDNLKIKYKKSNQEILSISFTLDFEHETKDYDRVIDINEVSSFTIGGGADCDIELKDPLIGRDKVSVTHRGGKLTLKDNATQYGIYINGLRSTTEEVTISDYDFFSVIGFSFYYKFGKLYTQKTPNMVVESLHSEIKPESDGRFNYPVFNRNTRIVVPIPDEEISILDPPAQPEKNKENFILRVLPTLAMVGVMAVMANMSGGGSNMLIRSGLMAGVTIIMTVIGIINDKRTFKKDTEHRDVSYRTYIEKKKEEVQGKRQIEKGILEDNFLSADKELLLVEQFSSDLFDRIPEDTDFLNMRLGTGSLKSAQPISFKEQETLEIGDELTLMPAALANEYHDLPAAPITIDGKAANAIGIVGSRVRLYEMLKNILLDVTTRHYYDDVQLFLMVNEKDADSVFWTRFLPHLNNERIGIRNIVCDEESKNTLFEYLYKELSAREAGKISTPRIVVLSYSDLGMKSHPISGYFDSASEIGVTFIFFEEKKHLLPLGCDHIVMLQNSDNSGTVVARNDDSNGLSFSYDPISDAAASFFAQKLAPVYCEEVSLESNLTKNITLYELLDIYSPNDLNLEQRWTESEIHKSMAAPLGVNAKSDVVCLDLHEKFHGPHGLVAGTTGSGKSEILQSYILSIATLFHPYEVSFVIIDFKGGGMVGQFKDLPHLNGAITNIDGREINRSLLSIKAELRKRQELFLQAEVNNIGDYIKMYKSGKVSTPLPHLVLVVDEFAELKQDQPEFMKELVSAARIGRSLGVHLILATQKPSGVVDDQIWSNSKFKLCLKVQNQADSNEVLKSPLAAEIREPGRAYLQVGNNEIFELFQSAYSGAPAITNTDQKKKFQLYSKSMWGKRSLIYEQKPEKTGNETETQLDALVNYIAEYANENSIEKIPGICLPPLRENISYIEAIRSRGQETKINIPLGIYDDPTRQAQDQVSLDLLTGNTIIVGATQFGKTAMLQSIIRGVAENNTSADVSMYLLDFASMALKMFDGLKHIGGVVTTSEDVKLKTFFRMMLKELDIRKEKLSKLGITSFSSYREAGYSDLPFILVMVDNLTAFKEYFEEYDDELLNLCREGTAYGICFIFTASSTRGITFKYMSNIPNRIALYCNQRDEYGTLFERCRMEPKPVPGRALISIDKEIYEYQNYLPFEGEKEIDRVNDIKKFITNINAMNSVQAKRIPEVPEVLTTDYIDENLGAPQPDRVIAGMDFDTVDAFVLDLQRLGFMAISGREKSGKSNFVKYFINHALKNTVVDAYVYDGYDKHLADLETAPSTKQYCANLSNLEETLTSIEAECQRRKELITSSGHTAIEQLPMIIIVIQHPQFFETDGISKACSELCKKIIKASRESKTFILFSNVENMPVAYGAPELLKMIKDTNNILYFDDLKTCKLTDISLAETRNHKKGTDVGDAFFITERSINRIKTPLYLLK